MVQKTNDSIPENDSGMIAMILVLLFVSTNISLVNLYDKAKTNIKQWFDLQGHGGKALTFNGSLLYGGQGMGK